MFDIELSKILSANPPANNKFEQISRFPEAIRDLALIVDDTTNSSDITAQILKQPYVTAVDIFDVYSGDELDPGKKSLGIRIHFQSMSETLTNEQISKQIDAIIDQSKKSFAARLRQYKD